jgi:hypothetical protein
VTWTTDFARALRGRFGCGLTDRAEGASRTPTASFAGLPPYRFEPTRPIFAYPRTTQSYNIIHWSTAGAAANQRAISDVRLEIVPRLRGTTELHALTTILDRFLASNISRGHGGRSARRGTIRWALAARDFRTRESLPQTVTPGDNAHASGSHLWPFDISNHRCRKTIRCLSDLGSRINSLPTPRTIKCNRLQ